MVTAVAWVQSLAQELPYVVGIQKKKKKKKEFFPLKIIGGWFGAGMFLAGGTAGARPGGKTKPGIWGPKPKPVWSNGP